jgi:hypothetical protein
MNVFCEFVGGPADGSFIGVPIPPPPVWFIAKPAPRAVPIFNVSPTDAVFSVSEIEKLKYVRRVVRVNNQEVVKYYLDTMARFISTP